MILLTGASGTIGGALLRRLTAAGEPTSAASCASPRRLGRTRVRALHIALGESRHRLRPRIRQRSCAGSTPSSIWRGCDPRPAAGDRSRSSTALATVRLAARRRARRGRRASSSSRRSARAPSRARGSSAPRRSPSGRCADVGARDRWSSRPRSSTRRGDPWLTLLRRACRYCPAMPDLGLRRERCTSRSGPRTWPTCVTPTALASNGGRTRRRLRAGRPGDAHLRRDRPT